MFLNSGLGGRERPESHPIKQDLEAPGGSLCAHIGIRVPVCVHMQAHLPPLAGPTRGSYSRRNAYHGLQQGRKEGDWRMQQLGAATRAPSTEKKKTTSSL